MPAAARAAAARVSSPVTAAAGVTPSARVAAAVMATAIASAMVPAVMPTIASRVAAAVVPAVTGAAAAQLAEAPAHPDVDAAAPPRRNVEAIGRQAARRGFAQLQEALLTFTQLRFAERRRAIDGRLMSVRVRADVGIVLHDPTEDALAVLGVARGVEDVLVPKEIERV